MDARQERGQVIAERCQLERRGAMWFVPSQSSGGKHAVDLSNTDLPTCTCADWELRQMPCKHIHAVTFTVKRQQNQDGSTTTTATVTVTEPAKRKTYPQQWPAYNKAQTREKDKFQLLLSELCRGIVDTTPRTKGQARLPLSEAIFACCFKVYSTVSGRRFMTNLRDATGRGYLSKTPHYNSIFNYLENPAVSRRSGGRRFRLPLDASESQV